MTLKTTPTRPKGPKVYPGREPHRPPLPATGSTPPAAVPPTLAEQKADFTAEGAPPPGKVDTRPPARTGVPGARKG